MKTLNVTFTDAEFDKLLKAKKKKLPWHKFILTLSKGIRVRRSANKK